MLQVAFETNHRHPNLDQYQMVALWSINERLAGRPGIDLPPPGLDWLDDCAAYFDWKQAEEEEIARKLRNHDG